MAPIGIYVAAILTLLVATSGHVSPAPPPAAAQQKQQQQQQDPKLSGKSIEKTADLSLLINETLRINSKVPLESGNQTFRDDWTFDRVEYDLMDFLQELNARYSLANKNDSVQSDADPAAVTNLEGERDSPASNDEIVKTTEAAKTEVKPEVGQAPAQVPPQVAAAPIQVESIASEAVKKAPVEERAEPLRHEAPQGVTSTVASSSVLPISLASGDHDISESTWQYGIFDRFTRPRALSTTPQPADTIALLGSSGATLDVRSFNSDECGLRSYRLDPDYFPASSTLDTDEIAKELQQRRQRLPMGASFFQSHKKYHHTAAGDSVFDRELTRDDLENREKLLPSPPFDRYGEPAFSSNPYQSRHNYSSSSASAANGSPMNSADDSGRLEHTFGYPSDSSSTSAESEFNLSSRRQWLQQQLGSTLQMLGFNSTNPAALEYFLNQTAGPGLSGRENMMKISAPVGKTGKALAASQAADVDPSRLSGPEITEQELKARQDELKLEARVIGGNDARLGDSPWSVSLQALVSRPGTGGVEYRHYCGGTIISEYYILTAAHCLDFMVGRESRLFVVVGDLNWRMSAASMHGRRFGIEKLIIHGGYKSTAFGHDIGLIRTKESMKPLKVNGRYIINSVCLPERNVEHSGEAELVGWGLFSNRNEMADSLQIADVPILPRPLCVDLYRRRTGLIQWLIGIELITEKQICAGTFGRGICQGDSGSALVYNEKAAPLEPKASSSSSSSSSSSTRLKIQLVRDAQQRATIIGVVAFGGIRRCSYQSLPGVYMQTSKYLDWILPRIRD